MGRRGQGIVPDGWILSNLSSRRQASPTVTQPAAISSLELSRTFQRHDHRDRYCCCRQNTPSIHPRRTDQYYRGHGQHHGQGWRRDIR
ncbi:hypothetical protein RRG08_041967 [Elysia crispata]|uniref:Uncharacterized protein n=1 Tax=Elysia crispata TaxID=231223 RepID=A0AAE0ZPV1_9GAST|nr:hypothetical protein RRG08_041967 [Elysia crispata]